MDGNFFLHLSAVIFISLIIILFYKNHLKYKISTHLIEALTLIASCSTIIALISLFYSYIISDLSVVNVALNSHPAMPLHYKIAALWGNHDGSLLLLTSFLALFILINHLLSRQHPIYCEILLIEAVIISLLLLFLVLEGNPFLRSFPIPKTGLGLNPILQDKTVMVHPPIVYLSHVSCIIIYAISLTGLKLQLSFENITNLLKPWLYLALAFTTLGIGLGSWWAYNEIGWGGFWFWDPVETLSILPWLLLIVSIHNLGTKGSHKLLIFSTITSFISIIFSIFLLRSGLVNSVHSFAIDLNKGYPLFIYLILSCFIPLYFISKMQLRIKIFKTSQLFSIITISSLLFIIVFIILVIAILTPIFSNFLPLQVVITEQFFQKITASITLLLIVLFAIFYKITFTYIKFCIISITSITISYYTLRAIEYLTIINCIILSTITLLMFYLVKKQQNFNLTIRDISHFSFYLLILSLITNYLFTQEITREIKFGDTILFLSKQISVVDFQVSQHDNKLHKSVLLAVTGYDIIKPSLQIFPVERQIVPDPFIINNLFYDLFFSIQQLSQDKFILNIQYKPMMTFLWLSICLFVITTMYQAIKIFISYKDTIRNNISKNTTALSRTFFTN
jgi:cytochrome c-type biogenesis protein CcmF